MTTLLVELFTEELPPKALAKLGAAFADGLLKGLSARGLASDKSRATMYATPRRLAAGITDVSPKGSDSKVEKKLMPAKVAFDAAGAPTPSLQKRLEKEAARVGDISVRKEGDADFAWLVQSLPGASLQDGLQATLQDAIARLPIPKVMRYQPDGAAHADPFIEFVRPAHGLVALYGNEVVAVSALGLKAGRVTHGHRFQGARDIAIDSADTYAEQLKTEGAVIASFGRRSQAIRAALDAAALKENANLGDMADVDALLDEVTALVERPAVYAGQFEAAFLAVPQECLILTMRQNQKYFPLFDAAGKLKNRFLIVSNMQLEDPHHVVQGNQRVVRPRLADAKFFFDFDRRERLETRLPALASVVYHNKLGSQRDRIDRLEILAGHIAGVLKFDVALAERAAQLAKADLVTNMVGEFPELQGIMGRYYALHDQEDPEVAQAIQEHYQPRFAGDALPVSNAGICAALADKLDTLAGIFAIGLIPTGDKDPFALRRAALGVIRILAEESLPLGLNDVVGAAFKGVAAKASDAAAADKILDFIYDRLRGYLKDRGYAFDEIEAVVSQQPDRIDQVIPRIEAVRAFRALPEAQALAAANKRVSNILRKSPGEPGAVDPALLAEEAEKALYAALNAATPDADAAFAKGDYAASLKRLAALRGAVDLFFDQVLVNAEDPAVRANRLALLAALERLFNRVADISKLAA
jgi:glycyl-tRNA synthetase beta chain